MSRRLESQRAVCPQCKRRRFIPLSTRPYCTPSCKRAADQAEAAAGTVFVYDVTSDQVREVTRAEAAAGMARYARSLGPGTPACGVAERQALEMLRGES